jgi:hypothetical protein
MSWLQDRVEQFQEWLNDYAERRQVRSRNQYAGAIEQQIREQLQQHHEQALSVAMATAFQEGIRRTRDAYLAEDNLLRATIQTQEHKIRELESRQSLTQSNKKPRAKPKKRPSKR